MIELAFKRETFSTSFFINQTCGTEDARFQRLFPNPSWLMSKKTSSHQNLVPTFPWIDNCLMVTKR